MKWKFRIDSVQIKVVHWLGVVLLVLEKILYLCHNLFGKCAVDGVSIFLESFLPIQFLFDQLFNLSSIWLPLNQCRHRLPTLFSCPKSILVSSFNLCLRFFNALLKVLHLLSKMLFKNVLEIRDFLLLDHHFLWNDLAWLRFKYLFQLLRHVCWVSCWSL